MEQNQSVNDASSGNAAENQAQETQSEPVRNPEAVLAKNRELLGLNKELKTKYESLASKLDELESEKMLTEGKKDEYITKLQSDLKARMEELNKVKSKYAYNAVTNQIKAHVARHNCVDPDAFIKLADLSHLEGQVDENFNIASDAIEHLVTEQMKSLPYLFQKQVPDVKDATPNAASGGSSSVDKMSVDELKQLLAKTIK